MIVASWIQQIRSGTVEVHMLRICDESEARAFLAGARHLEQGSPSEYILVWSEANQRWLLVVSEDAKAFGPGNLLQPADEAIVSGAECPEWARHLVA